MRSVIVRIGVALFPLLLVLCLSPQRARAATGPRIARSAGVSPLTSASRLFLAPTGLGGIMRPAVHGLQTSMSGWLGRLLWPASLTLHLPRSPATMLSMGLTGGVNRFLSLFSPDPAGPLLAAPRGLALLTVIPVAGVQSSGYGYRRDPIRQRRRKFHKGLDFRAPRGTPVHAAGPGVVEVARRKGSYGRLVIISHGAGLETRYAHLQRIDVKEGEFVPAGALVGTVGSTGRSTGPHLHFEVRRYGEALDPREAMRHGLDSPTLATMQ